MKYKISEIAALTGLSAHTLRFYEKEGLIEDVARAGNGIREYSDFDLEMVRSIECLKSCGMNLKEIKQHIELFKKGSTTYEARENLFRLQREKIEKKLAALEKQKEMTDYKIWYYSHMESLGDETDPMNCQKMRALYDKELRETE